MRNFGNCARLTMAGEKFQIATVHCMGRWVGVEGGGRGVCGGRGMEVGAVLRLTVGRWWSSRAGDVGDSDAEDAL